MEQGGSSHCHPRTLPVEHPLGRLMHPGARLFPIHVLLCVKEDGRRRYMPQHDLFLDCVAVKGSSSQLGSRHARQELLGISYPMYMGRQLLAGKFMLWPRGLPSDVDPCTLAATFCMQNITRHAMLRLCGCWTTYPALRLHRRPTHSTHQRKIGRAGDPADCN